jgi:hypothetical protein
LHQFKRRNETITAEVREWLGSQDRSSHGFDGNGNPGYSPNYWNDSGSDDLGWDDPATGKPGKLYG